MTKLPDTLVAYTLRDYCCAKCWGGLDLFHIAGQDVIECAKYGAEHAGFVRKAYTARRQQESEGDVLDVKDLLREMGVIDNPHKGKTAQQLLEELGF